MKFCTKCGTALVEGCAFCPGCGASVEALKAAQQQNQPVQPPQPAVSEPAPAPLQMPGGNVPAPTVTKVYSAATVEGIASSGTAFPVPSIIFMSLSFLAFMIFSAIGWMSTDPMWFIPHMFGYIVFIVGFGIHKVKKPFVCSIGAGLFLVAIIADFIRWGSYGGVFSLINYLLTIMAYSMLVVAYAVPKRAVSKAMRLTGGLTIILMPVIFALYLTTVPGVSFNGYVTVTYFFNLFFRIIPLGIAAMVYSPFEE